MLAAHPAVAEAAVFAVAHQTLGEDMAAAVVLRSGSAASELELRRFAATRLAAFKVPRRIVFVEAVPRTVTGKPQRAVLAKQSGIGTSRLSAAVNAGAPEEQRRKSGEGGCE